MRKYFNYISYRFFLILLSLSIIFRLMGVVQIAYGQEEGHESEGSEHEAEAPEHEAEALEHEAEAPEHEAEAPEHEAEAPEHEADDSGGEIVKIDPPNAVTQAKHDNVTEINYFFRSPGDDVNNHPDSQSSPQPNSSSNGTSSHSIEGGHNSNGENINHNVSSPQSSNNNPTPHTTLGSNPTSTGMPQPVPVQHYSLASQSTPIQLNPNIVPTVQNIANQFYAKNAKDIVVTSGTRTAHGQAEVMYDMLKHDADQNTPSLGISKYNDKAQAQSIKQAFDANPTKDQAVAAIEKILMDNVFLGRPISDHMAPSGAADIRTKDLSDKQKNDLFKICQNNDIHCIYEVPKNQMSEAQKLAKDYGIPVREAPHEHLHIDLGGLLTPLTVNRSTLDSILKLSAQSRVDPQSIPLLELRFCVPDLLSFSKIRTGGGVLLIPIKWYKISTETWIEWAPDTSNQNSYVQIWKEQGRQKIEGIMYTVLKSSLGLQQVEVTHKCWIPPISGTDCVLTEWNGGSDSYIPTPRFVKNPIAYPTDDMDTDK